MATPFRPATTLLKQYAEYHRDRRNIITHLVGLPMMVFGLAMLLSRPAFVLGGLALTPAWVLSGLAALWYLTRGQVVLGLAASAGVAVLVALAHRFSGGAATPWLAWSVGFIALGGLAQFIGHWYEGRKPASADDPVGLLVGPLFVALEMLAPLGLFKPLAAEIERHAGPTHIRDLAHPAT